MQQEPTTDDDDFWAHKPEVRQITYKGIDIFCGECSSGDFVGPNRATADEALADAESHAKEANDG